jgi:hypothetical protein
MYGRVWRAFALVFGGPMFVGGAASALRNGGGGGGLMGGLGLALVLLPFALRGLPAVEE